jgi:hypothetical protein
MGAIESAQNFSKEENKNTEHVATQCLHYRFSNLDARFEVTRNQSPAVLIRLIGLDCTHYHGASRVQMHQIRSVCRAEDSRNAQCSSRNVEAGIDN